MHSRFAIAAASIAALAPLPSHAVPIEAAPVPVHVPVAGKAIDEFVAPPRAAVPRGVLADTPPVRLPRALDDPIPYRFACDVTRWTGDPSKATTTVKRLEGVLGDEPVHFEADSYLIDDGTGPRGGSYSCTLKIGDGPENPDSDLSRRPLLVAASFSGGSHGHTLWKKEDGRVTGVAGARMLRGFLQRGHSMTWTWEGSISQRDGRRIEHAADCEGVTFVRGYSLSADGWCEHEEPRRRPMPAPREDEDVHDGLPPEVPSDVAVPEAPEVPVPLPLPLQIPSVPPVPVTTTAGAAQTAVRIGRP